MFLKNKNKDAARSGWNHFNSIDHLQEIEALSYDQTVGIFKHSTRCSISAMAKSRMEHGMSATTPPIYLLDLITYRAVSNEIADRYSIRHESPQLILLKDGKPIYNASHSEINMGDITTL